MLSRVIVSHFAQNVSTDVKKSVLATPSKHLVFWPVATISIAIPLRLLLFCLVIWRKRKIIPSVHRLFSSVICQFWLRLLLIFFCFECSSGNVECSLNLPAEKFSLSLQNYMSKYLFKLFPQNVLPDTEKSALRTPIKSFFGRSLKKTRRLPKFFSVPECLSDSNPELKFSKYAKTGVQIFNKFSK